MKLFSFYRVELRRLLLSRTVAAAAVLSMLSLPLGNILYDFSSSRAMSARYILTPVVMTGTPIGAVLWAAVMIMEADRLQRSGVHILTDTVAPPALLSAARTLALLTISTIVTTLTSLVYLPCTAARMSYLFSAGFYFANFAVFMLPTWWISLLFADAFYQITRRVELSVVLFIALTGVSVSGISSFNYFMRWFNPYVITYSDGFPSVWPLRIGLYTRLIWLCIATGIWLVSILCVRKYQKGLFFSFWKNRKKLAVLTPAVLSAATGIFLWHFQPFIDHGPLDYEYIDTLLIEIDDANRISAIQYSLSLNPALGTISAKAAYDIQVPYRGEDVLQLNPGYQITKMTYDGENVPFRTVDNDINGKRSTYFELPEDLYNKTLVIEYSGFPTQERCWANSMVQDTIDHDYISLSSTAIVPRLDNYYSARGSAVIDITIPDNLIPFLDYTLMTDFADNGDGTKTWRAACSEIVRDFTAGYYTINTFQIGSLNVDFAYGTAYQGIVEENDIEQTIIDILTYGSEHYGELWSAEQSHLLLRQESSMFGGGYALHGVSTWFETVLSPDTLSDMDKGASATEVFIHEMLHQWWGGLGLDCAQEDLWSSEGLTVYSTYRLVKEKYGALYAQQYYVDAWKEAVDNQNRSFYNRHPEYLELLPEVYQSQIASANRSINHYQRMPLMILKAEELVGGEDKMDEILRRMYEHQDEFRESGFGFADFLQYCGLTEEDIDGKCASPHNDSAETASF